MSPLAKRAPKRRLEVWLPEVVWAELKTLALVSRMPLTKIVTVAIRHLLHDHANAQMWPKEYFQLGGNPTIPMRLSRTVDVRFTTSVVSCSP